MEIRHRSRTTAEHLRGSGNKSKKNTMVLGTTLLMVVACCVAAFLVLLQNDNQEGISNVSRSSSATTASSSSTGSFGFAAAAAVPSTSVSGLKVPVFYPKLPDSYHEFEDLASLNHKLEEDIQNSPVVTEAIALDTNYPPAFVKTCGASSGSNTNALERIQVLKGSKQPHLALELLKYCALEHYQGGLYLDAQSPLTSTLDHILAKTTTGGTDASTSLAVLNDPKIAPKSIHSGIFYISKGSSNNNAVVDGMIQLLMTTSLQTLESSPLLLPKSLYDYIANGAKTNPLTPGSNGGNWYLLQHTCNLSASLGQRQVTAPISNYALNSHRLTQNCPEPNGFCCSIFDSASHLPAMMTKHLLLPYQVLPSASQLPRPLNAETGHFDEEDLPFISTLSEKVHPRPEEPPPTPNFFETLLQNDCLPSDKKCSDCLRNKQGANCKQCASVCPCYCKALCHIPVEEKFISKSLIVKPPLYARDPSRLVPRIIHQTFFEAVTPEKYPNMSRLIESFKQSGWEYKFYTDDMSLNFLSTHFPPEVREAYEALRPGAFKADLFRYCVLLIHGGVYADMDIMLESNLDLAVGPDVGFMVPQDEPGTPIDRRMCLWNGLIAAAPGHPFLAKVIETVVNNVRNRFTSVDTDQMFCPDPELSILHAFDTLFTAGPCILGAMVNKVLGRHGQAPFEAGEMDLWEASKQTALEKGTEFIIGVDDKPNKKIPGKTIILHQNKWDMGSHRFTLLEKNLVVAATDLPDSDDRASQEKPPEHYSKTHVKAGIYGLDRLYTDNVRANEELRFYVDAQWSTLRDESVNGSTQK